jgi:nitrate reductase NapD
MNISGVLLRVRPEFVDVVEHALAQVQGVELHMKSPDGRLVTTIEAADSRALADRYSRVEALDHVLCASVVYHHSEQLEQAGASK